LARGQLVVARDGGRWTDPDRASSSVGHARELVDGLRAAGASARGAELFATPTEQALAVAEQLFGLLAASPDQLTYQLVGVGAGHAPALGRLVERFLNPLATDHDDVQGPEDPVDELLDIAGDAVCLPRGLLLRTPCRWPSRARAAG
jgi:hypothetical protein